MFNRKKHPIVPYPSSSPIKNIADKLTVDKDTNLSKDIDILAEMRNSQVLNNAEYLIVSLLKEQLLLLNEINVSCKSIAVSSAFLGKHIESRFKWLS